MRVLVACEFSGTVRDAFRAKGHDAWSCDLIPSTPRSEFHIVRDVRELIVQRWDLVIAHPPCTYLANPGVRWFKDRPERKMQCVQAAAFFRECLRANAPMVAVENPIMHIYAKRMVGVEPTQIIQPWQFGHHETKATCLWLKGLPPLEPTRVLSKEGAHGRSWLVPPGPRQKMIRSITYPGIAKAMADQWGVPCAEESN